MPELKNDFKMGSWGAYDLTKCPHCGGELRVLKPIMARHEIDRYLKHQGLLEHPPPDQNSPTDNISYEPILD